jgi:soluble lytic murein transglycosylase
MRILIWAFILSPLWLVLSCSTSSKRDSSIDADQKVWLQAFSKALNQSESDGTQACEIFSKLASEEKFILKDLSLIRARIICSDRSKLATVPENFAQTFPHLASLNADRILKEAQASNQPLEIAKAYRAKAMRSDRRREKLALLQQAMVLANGDEALKADIQDRIYKIAPRLLPKPDAQDFYKIGADSIYNRDFNKGRKYLQKIYRNSSFSLEDRIQARKLYRNSFKIEQNREQFLVEAKKITLWLENLQKKRSDKDWKLLHEFYLTWARGAWTIGQADKAWRILNMAERHLNGHWSLEEIEFIRGRMKEETGDWAEALAHFEKSAKVSNEKSPFREKVLFLQAWMLRKLNRHQEATTALATLRNQALDPFDQNRFSFWLGRSLKQAGQAEEAKKEFIRLKTEDSLGYYGLLSYRELGEEMPPLPPASLTDSDWGILDIPTRKMISALLIVKETDILERYLNEKTSNLRVTNTFAASAFSDTWLAYLKAYAAAGLYLPLFAQLGSLEVSMKVQLLKDHPELLFPRKYIDLVQPSADKFGVSPEMMLAIIRQESAFNPFARSPADAFGLMQLLPSVANDQASRTGITLQNHEDLYEPAVNIPIGAALLSQLQKKYRGQFILMAAAYNASERAIEGWLKMRLREDSLEFIEDIPYDETRAYVKLVIRNFIFYSRLKEPSKHLAFPSWCLEDLQSFKASTN